MSFISDISALLKMKILSDPPSSSFLRSMKCCISLGLAAITLLSATAARAYSESLSFRLSLSGDVLAVAKGKANSCSPVFWQASSITRAGNVITIVSTDQGGGCFIPVEEQSYEVVADLGPLPSGQYEVAWRQVPQSISATLVTATLQMPRVAKIFGGGQQIAHEGYPLPRPFIVRVVDAEGIPVAKAPVVFAPAVGAESGVRRDKFGFRGFNVAADLATWGAKLPQYTLTTDKDGYAISQGPLYDPSPAASLYGAKVQLPFPQNVETFFSVLTLVDWQVQNIGGVVVEYFNESLDHYFMTANESEINLLDSDAKLGWTRSVGSFAAYPLERPREPSSVPVCRFFSAGFTSHFFTADPAECDAVVAKWPDTWTLETRTAFWIQVPEPFTGLCPTTTQPVYRLYNQRGDANHRYVTDRAIRDAMVANGWVSEGVGPDRNVMCAPR
ncbi:MAG: hypothetical protein ABI777_09520 [Betaproteobacteria bacterium]